jgi:hypothetical protein
LRALQESGQRADCSSRRGAAEQWVCSGVVGRIGRLLSAVALLYASRSISRVRHCETCPPATLAGPCETRPLSPLDQRCLPWRSSQPKHTMCRGSGLSVRASGAYFHHCRRRERGPRRLLRGQRRASRLSASCKLSRSTGSLFWAAGAFRGACPASPMGCSDDAPCRYNAYYEYLPLGAGPCG